MFYEDILQEEVKIRESLAKPMPRAVRVRSGALFDSARPELGRALEKDGDRA